MRIISGKLKGRIINNYHIEGTRPTMDRVKESIMGMIQNHISGAIVLDLFAGSGNYGIECLSNGAKRVYFNDKNKECIRLLKKVLMDFSIIDDSNVFCMDYREMLSLIKKENIKFDLIFLDPPYKNNVINEILNFISQNKILNKDGLVICELTNKEEFIDKQLVLWKERQYGDKEVFIYQMRD